MDNTIEHDDPVHIVMVSIQKSCIEQVWGTDASDSHKHNTSCVYMYLIYGLATRTFVTEPVKCNKLQNNETTELWHRKHCPDSSSWIQNRPRHDVLPVSSLRFTKTKKKVD